MSAIVAFPFGPWEPDKDAIDTGVCTEALNVAPKGAPNQPWYGPMLALAVDAGLPAGLPDAPNRVVGLAAARRSNNDIFFFADTTAKWYRVDGVTWDEVTFGSPVIGADEYWQFVQFGDFIYKSSFDYGLHRFDMNGAAGTNFTAVAGGPKAKYLSVFGHFMVAAVDKNAADKEEAFTFLHSAIEDPTGWTVGTALADYQVLHDGGQITGLVPATGNDGYILQERKIRRAVFQPGSDIAFRIEVVEERKGAARNYSGISVAGTVFFLSEDGFYSFGPAGLQAIGSQRVNSWFMSTAALNRLERTIGFVDSFAPRVGWAFYTDPNGTFPDHTIWYDWQLDRWTHSDEAAFIWAPAASEVVAGDVTTPPSLCAITPGRQLAFQNGPPRRASITTGATHFTPGARTFVRRVGPIGDFGTDDVQVRVGKRENPSGSTVWTPLTAPAPGTGTVALRSSGRSHIANITIAYDEAAADPWKHCQSVEAAVEPDGLR